MNFTGRFAIKMRLFTFAAVSGLALLILAGCSDPNIHTDKVRAALDNIKPEQKLNLEMALNDIDAGKFKEALLPLKKVADGAKLDKDQRKIMEDTLEKVRKKITQGG
jgi:hypothetical protein